MSELIPPPRTLAEMLPIYTEAMEIRHYSPHTIETQRMLMRWFVAFCAEREIHELHAVTRELVERYQRHLYLLRVNLHNAVGIDRIAVNICHVIRSTRSTTPPIR